MEKLSKNIVLIGMPGCGKTTIGKYISESLNIEFCDVDEYIVKRENKSITEIFENGEEHFRKIESESVKEVSSTYPKIISTGGGVVKNYKNIEVLRKKGIIIFINRPLKDISDDVDIQNRPLLKDGTEKLYILYDQRYKLYKEYCDYEILNTNLQECTEKIISILKDRG